MVSWLNVTIWNKKCRKMIEEYLELRRDKIIAKTVQMGTPHSYRRSRRSMVLQIWANDDWIHDIYSHFLWIKTFCYDPWMRLRIIFARSRRDTATNSISTQIWTEWHTRREKGRRKCCVRAASSISFRNITLSL